MITFSSLIGSLKRCRIQETRILPIVFLASLANASDLQQKTENSIAQQSITGQSSKQATSMHAPMWLNLPITLHTLGELGNLALKKQIKIAVFEAAALQHVMELFITQSSSDEKKETIALLRPFGRLSAECLSIWHLASFFKAYQDNEIFLAWKHGSALLESPLLPLLSAPDTEVFLHTLNSLAARNSFALPEDFKLDIYIWPLPPRDTLLAASRWFYLLRKNDRALIKSSEKHFTQAKNGQNSTPIHIWGVPTSTAQGNLIPTDLPVPKILEALPKNSFYSWLIGSFLFLAESQFNEPEVRRKIEAIGPRSRRQRVRMSRRQGLDYAETDPEAKSLEFAQLALRTSLSNFQGYLACLQLAYLYQKRGDSASEAKFIEKSLTYHVTTGTYLKLAQFHRDHGNFKKMHYYNTMAQEMDPRAVLIEGPQPSLDAHKN